MTHFNSRTQGSTLPLARTFAIVFAAFLLNQANAASSPKPLACNLKALSPAERARLHDVSSRLPAAVVSAAELRNGYRFTFDPSRLSLTDAGEWLRLERLCCPFLEFQLSSRSQKHSGLHVTIRGEAGAKQFILAEFPALTRSAGL